MNVQDMLVYKEEVLQKLDRNTSPYFHKKEVNGPDRDYDISGLRETRRKLYITVDKASKDLLENGDVAGAENVILLGNANTRYLSAKIENLLVKRLYRTNDSLAYLLGKVVTFCPDEWEKWKQLDQNYPDDLRKHEEEYEE
jgi:hypothetical protein